MIYEYQCRSCSADHEAERAVSERHTVACPHCQAPADDQEIQIQPIRHRNKVTPRLMSEGATAEKYGQDWRETAASKRMKRGEPSDGKRHLIPGMRKGDARVIGRP